MTNKKVAMLAILLGPTTALLRIPSLPILVRQKSLFSSSQSIDVAELSNGSVRAPTEGDRKSFEERQIRHKASGVVGVPTESKCRHGFPQATLWRPMGAHNGYKPISGLVRLTCPHLVKAVDELERGGAISRFNEKLNGSEEWKHELQRANDEHRRMRKAMMGKEEVDAMRARFNGSEKSVSSFLNAGIAGMSPVKLDDVKCLHAQLGDFLVRGDNPIGQAVAEALEEQGTSLGGCESCHEQCNWAQPETESTWVYSAQKNKSGLRETRFRRAIHKERVARARARAKSESPESAPDDAPDPK